MADQADDLGIPTKPVRPVETTSAPRLADLSRPGAVPVPASPRVPDLSRPGVAPAHASISPVKQAEPQPASPDNVVEARKLIVGQGISLSGDIASCDRLVVEGSVQANLQNCQHMTIAESGLFDGNAAIEDAEIRGRFEGDLVVRKRLLIRASGHVSGTVTYGEIEIEAGGKITGAIQAHERPNGGGTLNHPQSAVAPPRVWIPGSDGQRIEQGEV